MLEGKKRLWNKKIFGESTGVEVGHGLSLEKVRDD